MFEASEKVRAFFAFISTIVLPVIQTSSRTHINCDDLIIHKRLKIVCMILWVENGFLMKYVNSRSIKIVEISLVY